MTLVPPDDPLLTYTGFVCLERTGAGIAGLRAAVAQEAISGGGGRPLHRPAGPAPGATQRTVFHVDAPGALVEFATAASGFRLVLSYPPLEQMPARRVHYQGRGVVQADGVEVAAFDRPSAGGGAVTVVVALGQAGRVQQVRVVLPYADRVFLGGLEFDGPEGLCPWSPPARPRYVACGDSITQGFFASGPATIYPRLLADARGWEVLDLGYGGRTAVPSDGEVAGSLEPDVATLLVGVNDCLQQVPPGQYRAAVELWMDGFRRAAPCIPVYLITPLPVPGRWPGSVRLGEYRAALRALAAGATDPHLRLIEGPAVLPDDPALCQDGLHPNDEGFRVMARRLSALLEA
ncbi:MAG: SGNH/GDSL hydrolase family protein [Candidatus Latescibacterota bacterium]